MKETPDSFTLSGAATGNVDERCQTQTFSGRIKNLTTRIGERDATLTNLQKTATASPRTGEPVTSAQVAESCGAQAGKIPENAQINFSSGTARIKRGSVETMEHLTGIALACADSGLAVAIGGHTASQGSDEDNQMLSEGRALAVADFMEERGVPKSALNPVGFGEAQPVGDNSTAAGRAQSRRISFERNARWGA
ncbi:OmpA family protein [Sulfitobacter sp. F26169L]|uniref:OmpA family protein n=1 Tax=Sulfitobacter sp. F26169L TaxID=2996015 RepID=UPI002260DCB6|nr:OmpA family protein [Sulfitobacter sp. F26169L]MCX7565627.1 OmpA family protein [Sulfitobacter sp. F26169L]